MRAILFSATCLALFAAAATTAQAGPLAASPTDTIVVRLPNKAVMTLVVRDAQQLRQLPQYHLDSLVARLGGYIKRADEAAKAANTERVTTDFFPNKEQPGQGLPEEVRITTRKSQSDEARTNHVDVALDKVFGFRVKLDAADGKKTYSLNSAAARRARRDSVEAAQRARRASKSDLLLDLGLNALANKGTGAPDLRTLGSRYVSLGLNYRPRLGGPNSPLHVVFGPEFSFNNYMLEGNNKWVNVNGRTSAVPETSGRQYQKTKLATSAFVVPLMLQLRLREKDPRTGHSSSGFKLGAGGFVGYRLASWTKLKYFEEGNTYKDKDYGSYHLNDWQYGLQATVGYGSLNLFVKYHLNELFRAGQGPQAQTISFGLRLLEK